MRNNNFVWIVVFVFIGLVLYAKEKPGIIKKTWDAVFKTNANSNNPYKTPEPVEDVASATNEEVASASNSTNENNESSNAETSKTEEKGVFDKVLDIIKLPESQEVGESKTPEWILPKLRKTESLVVRTTFSTGYNEDHEQSAWVAYKLQGASTQGKVSRTGMDFEPDPKVKTRSALSSDYIGTGLDRGHLAPAGDFKCCFDKMKETFYMSNISPQNADFNRGIWENLETRVRSWARKEEVVYVVTGPILEKGLQTIGRYNKVSVPKEFYKIVVKKKGLGFEAIAFILPNEALYGSIIYDFVVTVDEVEKRTGLDFFYKLETSKQSTLEAYSSWESFNKKAR